MLRTWRAKERGGGGGGAEKKKERKRKNRLSDNEKSFDPRTRARALLLLKNARPVFPGVRETREAQVRIFANCHYVSVVQLRSPGYSVHSERAAAAPVPRPFFSPQVRARYGSPQSLRARFRVGRKSKKKRKRKERGESTNVADGKVPPFFSLAV